MYGCDLSGEIEREIEITDAKNIDWENIAQERNTIKNTWILKFIVC